MIKYLPISGRERQLLEEVETRELTVFSPFEASKILGVERHTARKVLSSLTNKGGVRRIERGKYVLTRLYNELDIYELVPHVYEPSYISMWSGLHYHGLTAQVPAVIHLVTTRYHKDFEMQGKRITYVSVRPRMFFGYMAVGKAVIAEPEKLIIDCLAFPQYSGGYNETKEAVEQAELDVGKLVEYAIHTQSPTICSRLGHLLESSGIPFDEKRLIPHTSKSYVWLDPTSQTKDYEPIIKWKIYANTGGFA